jgi:hypothetical protein
MSVEYHDRPNTVNVDEDQRSVDNVDQPNVVEVIDNGVTVTVVASVGAIGPQGPEGPQGPQGLPGAVQSITASSPLSVVGSLSPNISLSGIVGVANGGTGASSLTGYVKGSGTSAFTASATIPNTDITGLGTMSVQNANSVAITGGTVTGVAVPSAGAINWDGGAAPMAWDTTDSTLTLALNANVSYRLGAQELVRVINRTGTTIAKGKAVYILGAHGDRPEVALADASGELTAATTLGITAESIDHTAEGFVCITGILRGMNTNALTEGALVWLSETAGELTSTRPTQPSHGVFMGLCVRQAPGGAGILYVSVVNGQELEELHDVLITSPTAGQLFKRNAGNTLWVNASPGALTKTDDTNVTLTLGGSPSAALVNDTSLTLGWTGQLGVTRGGTGASSLTGYVKGNGVSAMTAASTIPSSDITGLGTMSTQNATSVAITGGTISGIADLAVADGGTGASTAQAAMNTFAGAVTSGQYLRGNGSNVVMSAIQAADVPTLNQNTTGTAAGLSQTLAVSSGGTGTTSLTGYLVGNGSSAFTAVSSIPGSAISGNIAGNAANVTGLVAVTNGGTGVGSLTGLVKGNGTSAFTAATSGVDYAPATSGTAILYGNGSGGFSAVSIGANLSFTGGTLSATGGGGGGGVTAVTASAPLASSGGATPDISFTGTLAIANGGTGQTTAVNAFDALAPTTTLGDVIYHDGTDNVRLAGQTTTTRNFLRQTGTGSLSAAPAWDTVTKTDVGLSNVENTALSTWAGSGNLTTTGTIRPTANDGSALGVSGTAYSDLYLASGAVVDFNAGDVTITHSATSSGGLTFAGASNGYVFNDGSVTLNTGTANGIAYLNASKVITTGSTLTFTGGNTLKIDGGDTGYIVGPSGEMLIGEDLGGVYVGTGFGVKPAIPIYYGTSSTTAHRFYAGSTIDRFRITTDGHIAIASTARLYLDGTAATGDTYLVESAANTLDLVAGGVTAISTTGTLTTFGTATVRPTANDGAALGASGTAWADLFLASGAVVNFNAGDVTITHAANTLTFGGATTGYVFSDGPITNALGAVGTPSYTFSGDLDTGLWSSAGNVLNFSTGGTERVRINASGRMLVNMTTDNMGLPLYSLRGVAIVNFSDTVAPELYLRRTRGNETTPTTVATNDSLGNIWFQGYGGTNYRSLALISAQCTTYTSDTDMTTALRFYTANASTASTERFRISGAGDVAIGSGAKLLLDSVFATGDTYLTETSANNIAIFTGGSERLRLDGSGNVGVNVTTFGTSAAGVLGLKNGTEPSSGPADTVQVYSVDRSAGNTIPAIYCEGSGVTNAGITSTTVTHKIALKVNGTVYYLLATTNAT